MITLTTVPATVDGGPGTGNGVVGGYAGVVFGVIAALVKSAGICSDRAAAPDPIFIK
jgi:hypothetical protein